VTGQDFPIELPEFVADGFLDGYDDEYIDQTEITARDPTWRGHGPVPDQRTATLSLAVGTDLCVVIEHIPTDVPEDRLILGIDLAVERYEEAVEWVADAETGGDSMTKRVTIERDSATNFDANIEFDLPKEIMDKSALDTDSPPCNRCGDPVPDLAQETIGEIVFCPECYDAVCGRCGSEIGDSDDRYEVEGVGAGTTCRSCTAPHVDWLCTECGTEIQDESSQVRINNRQDDRTYCADCGTEVQAQMDKKSEDVDPPF
jgi:DNA-directed RNA polymerase subunit RPC12/RpoP